MEIPKQSLSPGKVLDIMLGTLTSCSFRSLAWLELWGRGVSYPGDAKVFGIVMYVRRVPRLLVIVTNMQPPKLQQTAMGMWRSGQVSV